MHPVCQPGRSSETLPRTHTVDPIPKSWRRKKCVSNENKGWKLFKPLACSEIMLQFSGNTRFSFFCEFDKSLDFEAMQGRRHASKQAQLVCERATLRGKCWNKKLGSCVSKKWNEVKGGRKREEDKLNRECRPPARRSQKLFYSLQNEVEGWYTRIMELLENGARTAS